MSKQSAEQKRIARKKHKSDIRAAQYRASALRKAAKGESKSKAPVKHSTRKEYSHSVLDAKAQRRFEESQERQATYDKLSTKQKLAKIGEQRGESKKQTARLNEAQRKK